MFDSHRVYQLLAAWAHAAEAHWYPIDSQRGCYGPGYNNWGVQTNQKYVTALAALALAPDDVAQELEIDRDWALDRATHALRFSLDSHLSGPMTCTDGQQWGHTWISALGQERMLGAVQALLPHLGPAEKEALDRVMISESEWLLNDYRRGPHTGICAGVWGDSACNDPESNSWNGNYLWRTACRLPDHPHADAWREKAHAFLINAISIISDAGDDTIVAGKPVRERHVGGNFFPNYALDHHSYFNVGYMAICVSGAAMLHFDLKMAGFERPETLDFHQADLWRVLRRFIFSDGRLARLGGDTRVRYAYCQEYLLPSLLYAADQLGEEHAGELVEAQINLVAREFEYSGDGTFYGRRLAEIAATSPYYYTRLESDRACALGQLLLYKPHLGVEKTLESAGTREDSRAFEASVAGCWTEPEYGAAMHRGPSRLASFAWRAHRYAQGLVLPPHQGHFAEWERNLSPVVRFMGDDEAVSGGKAIHRELESAQIRDFEGGFLTWGSVLEGVTLNVAEGWNGGPMARSRIVFAALPDGHTTLGFHLSHTLGARAFPIEVKGLHWCIPNDLYTGHRLHIETWEGELPLQSPPQSEETEYLPGNWLNVDGEMGSVILYGARGFSIHRTPYRRAGKFHSLYVEEVCLTCKLGAHSAAPNQLLIDDGWALLSGVDAETTRAFAERNADAALEAGPAVRAVRVTAADGYQYILAANFSEETVTLPDHFFGADGKAGVPIPPYEARLWQDTGEGGGFTLLGEVEAVAQDV